MQAAVTMVLQTIPSTLASETFYPILRSTNVCCPRNLMASICRTSLLGTNWSSKPLLPTSNLRQCSQAATRIAWWGCGTRWLIGLPFAPAGRCMFETRCRHVSTTFRGSHVGLPSTCRIELQCRTRIAPFHWIVQGLMKQRPVSRIGLRSMFLLRERPRSAQRLPTEREECLLSY